MPRICAQNGEPSRAALPVQNGGTAQHGRWCPGGFPLNQPERDPRKTQGASYCSLNQPERDPQKNTAQVTVVRPDRSPQGGLGELALPPDLWVYN